MNYTGVIHRRNFRVKWLNRRIPAKTCCMILSMTTAMNETPMMHTHTIEAASYLSEAMNRKLTALSLDFTVIPGPTHSMFIINQNTEAEREAVRAIGREIASYEQKQYEKIASEQTVDEAKKLRRLNLIRMFTLRQPLEALPTKEKAQEAPSAVSNANVEASTPAVPVNAPERPVQAPTVR